MWNLKTGIMNRYSKNSQKLEQGHFLPNITKLITWGAFFIRNQVGHERDFFSFSLGPTRTQNVFQVVLFNFQFFFSKNQLEFSEIVSKKKFRFLWTNLNFFLEFSLKDRFSPNTDSNFS